VTEDGDHRTRSTRSMGPLPPALQPPRLLQDIPADLVEVAAVAGPRFQIREVLGRGSGGVVHLVEDRLLQRRMALKTLHVARSDAHDKQVELLREARITARLQHPQIPAIFDFGRDHDGRVYFSMPEHHGTSLRQLLEQAAKSRVPPPLATIADRIQILQRVCDAVAYAHGQGVVHQDLKPENILLGTYGEVLVVDWGTALLRHDHSPGMPVGTPMYMAPEQVCHSGVDERSDVYCLGGILLELLTLRLPIIEQDSRRFWAMKRQGRVSEPDAQERSNLPEYLLTVAMRALSPDPQQRYRTVFNFAQALADYQRHLASIELCERTEQALRELALFPDHGGFARAEENFRQALAMWPGHARAKACLLQAQADHARFAVAERDLELAFSLLDPDAIEHQDLFADLAQARAGRLRRRRASRLAVWWLATACLLALTLLLLLVERWHRRSGTWTTIRTDQFGAVVDHGPLDLTKGSYQHLMPLPLSDERGLALSTGQMLWLRNVRELGDVRLEVEITWPERVDGFEMLIHAERRDPVESCDLPRSYSCQFGGYDGSVHYLSLNRRSGVPNTTQAVLADCQPGQRYRVSLQLVDDVASMYLDGEQLLSVHSLLPIGGADNHHLALRSWGSVRVHRLRVQRYALPRVASPLKVPDGLAAHGHLDDALAYYRVLAEDHSGTDLAEQALARAFAIAEEQGRPEAAELLSQLQHEFPDSRYLPSCLAVRSERIWRDGDLDRALQLCRRVQTLDHSSTLALRLLAAAEAGMPLPIQQRLLQAVAASPGLIRLDLRRLGLQTLDPLQGLRLHHLLMDGNKITDLSPLVGMPLQQLDISRNPIANLEPLAGMALQGLKADACQISSLLPLQGMPLRELALDDNNIDDISILADCSADILLLSGNAIHDLSSLKGKRFQRLSLHGNAIVSVAPLSHLVADQLDLSDNLIDDIGPLATAVIRELDLSGNRLAELSALRGLDFDRLDLSDNELRHLDGLEQSRISELDLSGNALRSLIAVQNARLTSLDIGGNHIDDCSPLLGQPLAYLRLDGNPIHDARPLAACPLRVLEADAVPFQVETLFEVRVRESVRLSGIAADPAAYRALRAAWQQRGVRAMVLRELDIQAAVSARDGDWLRRLAESCDDHLLLHIPGLYSWAAAKRLAAEVEAHLVRPATLQRQAFLARQLLWPTGAVWLDLHRSPGGQIRWGDGRQVDFRRFERSPRPEDQRWFCFSNNGSAKWIPVTDTDAAHGVVLEWLE